MTTMATEARFTSGQVIGLTKATYRQLDYWCSTGLIPGQPVDSGSGSRRRWTYQQVRHVRCLTALSAAGVAGANLRNAVEKLADPNLDWYRPLELDFVEHITLCVNLPALW